MAAVISTDSQKRERFIQIGKHRFRIANDHHALLVALLDEFPYLTMQQLLFLTSIVGANLLQVLNPMSLINVRKSRGGKL